MRKRREATMKANEVIKLKRKEKDMTLRELAEKVGVSEPTSDGEKHTILSQIQHLWLTSWLTRT
jgi:predicted transcriptional regulator